VWSLSVVGVLPAERAGGGLPGDGFAVVTVQAAGYEEAPLRFGPRSAYGCEMVAEAGVSG
jgi:hypothetical protein